MIFDTHTHYDDKVYDADRDAEFGALLEAGVGRICNSGSTFRGAMDSVSLSQRYDFIYASVGLHPDEVYDFYQDTDNGRETEAALDSDTDLPELLDESKNPTFARIKELVLSEKVVAIGEIGLDYHGFDKYKLKPGKALQKYWFLQQLKLAIEYGLPAVIHSRNASADTMEIMTKAHQHGLKCADIHCYSYSKETALNYLDMGFYLGFGGVITYEGQRKLTKVLEATPIDRILLETDCPYLTPDPIRVPGTYVRNSSRYLKYVIEKIAAIKGLTPLEVEDATWENAKRFYGIDEP